MSVGNFRPILNSFPAAIGALNDIGVDNPVLVNNSVSFTGTVSGTGISGNYIILPVNFPISSTSVKNPSAILIIFNPLSMSTANQTSNPITLDPSIQFKTSFAYFQHQTNPSGLFLTPQFNPTTGVVTSFTISNTSTFGNTYVTFFVIGI